MAEKQIATTIVLRNDTAENWTTKNPILKEGEIGVENGANKFKIGDGVKHWSELNYAGGDDAKNFIVIPTDGTENDIQAIIRVIGSTEVHTGDTAIVKRGIGDGTGKMSYTAYVYDSGYATDSGWKAMDGNYSAENVYFDDDLTYTVAIGTLSKPSGSAKLPAAGKSVKQVLSSILAKEANPSATKPAVSFSAQSGFGTFEIGTKKTLTYTATLSAGSYTYGPATGITAQSWSVKCDGVEGTKSTANGSFENVVAEATAKNITATATYNQGAMPKTNLGNDYAAARIDAGSASRDSNNLVGVRYMFYGPMTEDSALTSATIRALSKKEAAAKKTLSTFGAGAGAKKVVVAVPAGHKVTKVLMPSAMNADATASFVKQSAQVQVEGAENYAATAYDVWVYQPASIDSTETYAVTIG